MMCFLCNFQYVSLVNIHLKFFIVLWFVCRVFYLLQRSISSILLWKYAYLLLSFHLLPPNAWHTQHNEGKIYFASWFQDFSLCLAVSKQNHHSGGGRKLLLSWYPASREQGKRALKQVPRGTYISSIFTSVALSCIISLYYWTCQWNDTLHI